jgi:hypothetical protein
MPENAGSSGTPADRAVAAAGPLYGIPDNVASEHLRLMQRCGFFTSQRQGRKVYYQVAEPHLQDLMSCIENRFLAARS